MDAQLLAPLPEARQALEQAGRRVHSRCAPPDAKVDEQRAIARVVSLHDDGRDVQVTAAWFPVLGEDAR